MLRDSAEWRKLRCVPAETTHLTAVLLLLLLLQWQERIVSNFFHVPFPCRRLLYNNLRMRSLHAFYLHMYQLRWNRTGRILLQGRMVVEMKSVGVCVIFVPV